VDAGEASAIGLALRQQAAGHSVPLVVDDRCGRAEARQQGVVIMGTVAVLVHAKERGFVAACVPLLTALREQGYFLSRQRQGTEMRKPLSRRSWVIRWAQRTSSRSVRMLSLAME